MVLHQLQLYLVWQNILKGKTRESCSSLYHSVQCKHPSQRNVVVYTTVCKRRLLLIFSTLLLIAPVKTAGQLSQRTLWLQKCSENLAFTVKKTRVQGQRTLIITVTLAIYKNCITVAQVALP